MVSAQTIRYLTLATTAANYFGTFSAAWDSTKSQYVLKLGRPMRIPILSKLMISIGQIFPALYALFQGCMISFLLGLLIYFQLTELDKFLTLFGIICFVMAYVAQTQLLLHFEDFIYCFNSFLHLDNQIRMLPIKLQILFYFNELYFNVKIRYII